MGRNQKRKIVLKVLLTGVVFVGLQCGVQLGNVVLAADENNGANTANTTNTNTNTTTTPTTPKPVEKKAISKLKINANTSIHSYFGEPRKPSVKVYDGNTQLKVNRDYTVTYKNNVNPGKATIIIKGIGNYTGTVTKYFYIAPGKARLRTVTFNSNNTAATLRWGKDNKADGYRIYVSEKENGNYEWIDTVTNKNTTSYTIKGLNPKKEYYFKMRAYKIIDGKKICKKYSDAKTQDKLIAKVSLTAKGSGSNRNYNLKKATGIISGTVLKPGQTFNWFRVVGPASAARGYKKASVFQNGKTVQGYGGGVCQVSTTLYQASKKAGLQIVERHIHSKPVTYTKLENDATVSYGVQNLRIKNNKNYSIRIVMSSSGGETTCKLYRVY